MGSAERGTSVRATTRITATIIVALCAMTVHADAYAVTAYAAGGVATYDSGGLILAYGVRCNSRMYPKQSPQDHDWVNSLYARQDDGDFLEAGWYWTPTSTNRIWFSVLQQRGYMYPEHLIEGVPLFPDNSWPRVALQQRTSGSETYDIYIEGVWRCAWFYTDITSCRASVTSERYTSYDYNKGAWTYSELLTSSRTWTYWPHAARITTFANPDPLYRFYSNYIDRFDHYVYCDDHQN